MRANNVPKREYQSNRHGVSSCKDRIVGCPKYRRKVLVEDVDKRLKEINQQTAAEFEARIIELEVLPEPVHLLGEADPQFGGHRLVGSMKGRSLRRLRQAYSWLRSRLSTLWTHSYFVATVGGAPLTMIKQYIENQKNV